MFLRGLIRGIYLYVFNLKRESYLGLIIIDVFKIKFDLFLFN